MTFYLFLLSLIAISSCQDTTPFFPELGLDDVFPNARFDFPLEIKSQHLPILGSNETEEFLYIVSRPGRIFSIEVATGISELFLDISSMVETDFDFGLLGLAFHPNFLNGNTTFFIHYSMIQSGTTIISRWEFDLETRLPILSSEKVILSLVQPGTIHHGGSINFGSDGFLYFLSGDGGDSVVPIERIQGLDTLYGKAIRIDIDSPPSDGLNYSIPVDNPLFGMGGDIREEIISVGFRNPFSWSVDSQTGIIWLGDVGSSFREEIDIIIPNFTVGQVPNYGWNAAEGNLCLAENETDCDGFVPPILDYTRDVGTTVIGGYVYRGDIPEIYGMYIYGDFEARKIWALEFNPLNISDNPINHFLFEIPDLVTTFGVDSQENLYLSYFGSGGILKFSVNGGAIPDLDNQENDGNDSILETGEIVAIALVGFFVIFYSILAFFGLSFYLYKKKNQSHVV